MTHDDIPPSLAEGLKIIKQYVKTLPDHPGVYRMVSAKGDVLYVGKAKNLKKRVQNYTQIQRLPHRLRRMVSETLTMEFVTTHTEGEALLLEANFIKKLSPKYNILLKDDKFFSYVALTRHLYPRLMKHRGVRNQEDLYFGPFASTDAVNQSLGILHRIFRLRSCTDSFFATRKRPCLQYFIKRCTAPCVGYIQEKDYQDSVKRAIQFLEGKSQQIQKDLADKMNAASLAHAYEKAAVYRDQIRALTQLQSQQRINIPTTVDADVFGIAREGNMLCVQVFFFRAGSNYGSASLFPKHTEDLTLEETLISFLAVFYADKEPPKEILLNHELKEKRLLEEALSLKAGFKVTLLTPHRGPKYKVVAHAALNAQQALARKLNETQSFKKRLEELRLYLTLPSCLERIEVYDNSHTQGQHQIGALIVAGPEGFQKQAYRKFNIRTVPQSGDDYGMMREVFKRRFSGSLAQEKDKNTWPDLILIDGGKGQLNTAQAVLEELGLDIPLLAIAKGPERNAGMETFYRKEGASFTLESQPLLLYFLQRLRDEAHRFAIGTHRSKRLKGLQQSLLDQVPGIGSFRKRALLRHFGSAQAVSNAAVEDLKSVEGISENLAQKIYNWFHD